MPVLHAIVLGIVQGLTEFLPVSSSGHLDLVPWLLGWHDFAGPRGPALDKAFDVALHVGTFAGAATYFAPDLLRLARAGLGVLVRRPAGAGGGPGARGPAGAGRGKGAGSPETDCSPEADGRIAWLLVLSAAPAALTGALGEGFVENHLSAKWLIGTLLVAFGLVLWAADRLPARRGPESLGVGSALAMGAAQALALAPGVSRSGVTISAARGLGFHREAAVRLSFLMSLPIIAGAGLYKGIDVFAGGGIPRDFAAAFVAGMATAAITGWLAVWGMLRLVRTRSFTPFVVYRVALGVAVIVVVAAGWR